MMTCNIVESGSKGNMILVNDTIALDMGITYKKAKPYLKNLKLIFISHLWLHKDHLLPITIKTLIYNKPSIKIISGSEEVVKVLINQCNVPSKNIFLLKPQKWYDIGLCKVKLDELVHDTPNYAIHIDYNNEKMLYVVDTADISHIEAKAYDMYCIEANYNDEVLKKHIEECNDKNKLYYLNRVSRTHLSEMKARDFLIENMGANSSYLYLHKSNYNFIEEGE